MKDCKEDSAYISHLHMLRSFCIWPQERTMFFHHLYLYLDPSQSSQAIFIIL